MKILCPFFQTFLQVHLAKTSNTHFTRYNLIRKEKHTATKFLTKAKKTRLRYDSDGIFFRHQNLRVKSTRPKAEGQAAPTIS